jgi:MFS superfamily sulfate permease-like transporter
MPIVQYVITVKKVRSNMNKLEINIKKMGKSTLIMLAIALVIAIILFFIDPVYAIILIVSGIMGIIVGFKMIDAFIPDDISEFLHNLAEIVENTKTDALKDALDKMNENNNN